MLSGAFNYEEVRGHELFCVVRDEDAIYRGMVLQHGSRVRHGYGVV
jgi:hypothetical protein